MKANQLLLIAPIKERVTQRVVYIVWSKRKIAADLSNLLSINVYVYRTTQQIHQFQANLR